MGDEVSSIFRIQSSGPIEIAEVDCHSCQAPSTLDDPRCRACVLERLGAEGRVDRVVLKRSLQRVYDSPRLHELAKLLASIKHLIFDRTLYAPSFKGRCKRCVEGRMDELSRLWRELLANPHDLAKLEELKRGATKLEGECERCTSEYFLKLLRGIEESLKGFEGLKRLTKGYDQAFRARTKPFFVEGVWHPPPAPSKLLDDYPLPEGRGRVRIHEQLNRPVPFYELDLPELRWPEQYLSLLEQAFELELEEAPGHARFALPTKVFDFARDWYNALLHLVRERSELNIPSTKLRELAQRMASWLVYKVLEPLSYDDHLTDIYIPAPPELQPMYVVHDRWGLCETGVHWTTPGLVGLGEMLASRLGTAFDEVRPQLDAELPELGMRLFLTRHPAIWPRSVAVAVRKRRRRPWTQPLFLERGTLTPLASSLVSNFIRAGASAFVIGEKGSAKTSEIETLVPEIGPHHRIICFQDTEELHVEEFVAQGYKLENVRILDPEHLQRQIDAFLRGGESYWLITEVRATEAVKAALGAAARQGSQPLVTSFHVRSKREMYDLVCNIMGLHEAAYKYVDLILSTARFSTPRGSIRRVVEVAEVLKDWRSTPEYVDLFVDDRKSDLLALGKFIRAERRVLVQLNSFDLSGVEVKEAVNKAELLPPEEGGSRYVHEVCKRFAWEPKEFLARVIAEAKMKSELLKLAQAAGTTFYLELPFVSQAYDAYFSAIRRHEPDFDLALKEWRKWLSQQG